LNTPWRYGTPLEKIEWEILRTIDNGKIDLVNSMIGDSDLNLFTPVAFVFAMMCHRAWALIPLFVRKRYWLSELYCDLLMKYGLHHLDDLKQGLWPDGCGPKYRRHLLRYYEEDEI
jgi:hypothetical protein